MTVKHEGNLYKLRFRHYPNLLRRDQCGKSRPTAVSLKDLQRRARGVRAVTFCEVYKHTPDGDVSRIAYDVALCSASEPHFDKELGRQLSLSRAMRRLYLSGHDAVMERLVWAYFQRPGAKGPIPILGSLTVNTPTPPPLPAHVLQQSLLPDGRRRKLNR